MLLAGSNAAPATADSVVKVDPVGDNPGGIAVNTSTDTAYVSTIEGIFSVRGGVPGGGRIYQPRDYSSRLAVNSATNKLYASDAQSLAVIDGATKAAAVVSIGATADALAVNEKTNKVYVGTGNGLTVIDGATNTATAVPLTGGVQEIAVNTTTDKTYLRSAGTVKVLDGSGKISPIVGAGGVIDIAVNPKLNKIYVANKDNLMSISGSTDTITRSLGFSSSIYQLAVNSVTDRIYVGTATNSVEGSVRVVDGATMRETANVSTATRVRTIVVNPSNNKIYATMNGRGTAVIDGGDNTSTAVYTGMEPNAAAVNPSSNRVFIANNGSASVAV
ncbi:hypothetical protein M707_25185, partial [Arthrobacter sp. AK-YN10]